MFGIVFYMLHLILTDMYYLKKYYFMHLTSDMQSMYFYDMVFMIDVSLQEKVFFVTYICNKLFLLLNCNGFIMDL